MFVLFVHFAFVRCCIVSFLNVCIVAFLHVCMFALLHVPFVQCLQCLTFLHLYMFT